MTELQGLIDYIYNYCKVHKCDHLHPEVIEQIIIYWGTKND